MSTKYGIVSLLSDDVSKEYSSTQPDYTGGLSSSLQPSPFYPVGLRLSPSCSSVTTTLLPLVYIGLISFIVVIICYQCRDSVVDKSDKVMLSFFYMSSLLLTVVVIYLTHGSCSINPWYFLVVVSVWTLCTIYDSSELLRVQIEKTDASVEVIKNRVEEDETKEVVIIGKKELDTMSTKLSELSKNPIRDATFMIDSSGYNISDFVHNNNELAH
jgi:hypothetical protein